jgi:putative ABC transport system permease protein
MRRIHSFYVETFRIALQSIFAHKLRAFLTLIGIIIGVASVVVVGAAISGLNTYVVEKMSKMLGSNHFMIARMVSAGQLSEEELEKRNRRNPKLEFADMEWLREHCKTCSAVGAQVGRGFNFEHEGVRFLGGIVFGVTANMAEIEDKTIVEGRFIDPVEVETAKLVVVLGADIKDKFFPDVDAVGKTLKVGGLPMLIIGVEERRGPMFGELIDKHVYIPISTFGRIYGRPADMQIHGKGAVPGQFQLSIEDARTALRNYHKLSGSDEDDFGLVNTEELGGQIDQFTSAIALVVTPVTLLSLVVGGIVVMNIMLVSVTERTFEIGLRKALGARRKQILMQFLVESALLCGLLAATGIAYLISTLTPITMTITVLYIVLAIGFSSVIGIIAGIYPAFKASRLDPIVALTRN